MKGGPLLSPSIRMPRRGLLPLAASLAAEQCLSQPLRIPDADLEAVRGQGAPSHGVWPQCLSRRQRRFLPSQPQLVPEPHPLPHSLLLGAPGASPEEWISPTPSPRPAWQLCLAL